MPAILLLGKLRQKDCCEFQDSYIIRPCRTKAKNDQILPYIKYKGGGTERQRQHENLVLPCN